ncbi:hypothetical protein CTheo_5311 [Ceratobasidium theobromae]|uniref:Wax synthase domain-containing protein n=1 Tax=Ceratobasidium theobromae TaxID=1582974 RepID=A0A5N5QHX4_9AGAM|nr:hypothetical protein CTheo_5311 [Ceratobasidium theobromae]
MIVVVFNSDIRSQLAAFQAGFRRQLTISALIVPFIPYLLAIYYSSNKRLFPYRNIFTPIALFVIYQTCTSYAIFDSPFNIWNFGIGAAGCALAMRLVALATLSQPLKRKSEVDCSHSSLFSLKHLLDVIDYSLDLRGLHWNLGYDCHLPTEIRTTSTLFDFEVDTLFLAFKHALTYTVLHTAISLVGSVGSTDGGTIFVRTRIPSPLGDISVSPFFTACFVSLLAGLLACNTLMTVHLFLTFFFAPFYPNPAKSWPPLFGSPLYATSVHNFWSYQWHSVLRHGFCSTGGKLGWEIGGSIGAVLGVFLVSGLVHDFGMWCMGQGMEFSRVTAYFVLQGIIVLLEKTFDVDIWVEVTDMEDSQKVSLKASITGYPKQERIVRKNSLVDNGLGKLWTAFWIVVPATLMIDAWARRGFFAIPFDISPVRHALRFWANSAHI